MAARLPAGDLSGPLTAAFLQALCERTGRQRRHLVPAGAPVWAQVAPANSASVRAFLAAGFRPVGAEALLSRAGGARP